MTDEADSFDELFDVVETAETREDDVWFSWETKTLSLQTAKDYFSPGLNVPYVGQILDMGEWKGVKNIYMVIGVDNIARAYSYGCICISTSIIRLKSDKTQDGDPLSSSTSTFLGEQEMKFLFDPSDAAPANIFEGMSFYAE
jgi:hypothetical protein